MASAAEPAATDMTKKEPNYKTFEIYRWVTTHCNRAARSTYILTIYTESR